MSESLRCQTELRQPTPTSGIRIIQIYFPSLKYKTKIKKINSE